MIAWTSAQAADGPKLVKWLASREIDRDILSDTQERAMRRWRDGENALVLTVDELLVDLGLHLSEVPDEIWRERTEVTYSRRDIQEKPCAQCGGNVPSRHASGRALGPKKYAKKKFCSSECYVNSRRVEPLPKREVEEDQTWLLERAEQLHAVGLSWTAIAGLFKLDYGVECSGDNLRNWMKLGVWAPGRGTRRA